jgi:hypothetical protein
MSRLVLIFAVLAVGCSSSSNSFTCCFDIQGDTTFWTCPDEASFNQCCGGSTPAACGMNITPANTCTPGTGTTCSVNGA